MMKKRYIVSAIGAVGGAIAAGYLYRNNNKHGNDASNIEAMLEDAGIPDQSRKMNMEQLENAKMVSEGSQFGVQYYNDYRENHE